MNDLETIKQIIAEAGATYFAVQKNVGPGGNLVLFEDPKNPNAGLVMYERDMTSVEAVKKHIEWKRKEFKMS
jgi:hypothetical protein